MLPCRRSADVLLGADVGRYSFIAQALPDAPVRCYTWCDKENLALRAKKTEREASKWPEFADFAAR